MARACTVCAHDRLTEIDQALINGESLADIGRRFQLNRQAVGRHRNEHLPRTLAEARDTLNTTMDDDLFGRLEKKRKIADALAAKAHKAKHTDAAVRALAESRKYEELLAKARGELAANAIPRAELVRIMTAMSDAVCEFVTDPEILDAIRKRWAVIDV